MEAALELGRGWKSFEVHTRNLDVKGNSGEFWDGNEEYVIGHRRKGDPCYQVARNFSELCSSVLWKMKLESDEIWYLAEEISEQSVIGATW